MRVGGGINFVIGKQGDGKTYYAVKKQIVPTLLSQRHVVTNVQLLDGWAERVAWLTSPLGSKAKRARIASNLQRYYLFEPDVERAIRLKPPREHGREAAGRWVWDELHNDMGNRSWNADGREELVHRLTHYRKMGWAAFLLTQHPENADKAVRRVANNVIILRNQKERVRLLGLRVTPWPLFLASWFPSVALENAEKSKVTAERVERYFLGPLSGIYDSWVSVASSSLDGSLQWDELPAAGHAPLAALPAAEDVP